MAPAEEIPFDAQAQGNVIVRTANANGTFGSKASGLADVNDLGVKGASITADTDAIHSTINAYVAELSVLFQVGTYLTKSSFTIPIPAPNFKLSRDGSTLQADTSL